MTSSVFVGNPSVDGRSISRLWSLSQPQLGDRHTDISSLPKARG